MEPIYRTGNETVDRLSRLQITGNVIPAAWYRTIRRETGKPYLNAIVILSDIVFWYRAAEIRDEGSGQLLGYRKRFKADLLQRSYQQMADQFGISKRDATNAVVALEKLGVVKRVFRTLETNGQSVPNVLFLSLDVEVLERLTYPEEFEDERGTYGMEVSAGERGLENQSAAETRGERDGKIATHWRKVREQKRAETGETAPLVCIERMHEMRGYAANLEERGGNGDEWKESGGSKEGCHLFEGDVSPEWERGVTEISETPPPNKRDGPTEMGETNTEITYKDYNRDYPILSYQETKEVFKQQVEYEILVKDGWDQDELDELVEIAVDVLLSNAKTIRVNREEKPAELVKRQYGRLTMMHMQYVLNSLRETETKAHNIRAVMVTTLYNAANTIGSYYGNLYRYHGGRGGTG